MGAPPECWTRDPLLSGPVLGILCSQDALSPHFLFQMRTAAVDQALDTMKTGQPQGQEGVYWWTPAMPRMFMDPAGSGQGRGPLPGRTRVGGG